MVTGEQIKIARGLIGWSQERLAKTLNISRNIVSRLETTEGELNPNNINELSNILDVLGYHGIVLAYDAPDKVATITIDYKVLDRARKTKS